MMLRVRPAQLTTTIVSGDGAISRARKTSSAPGTLMAVGIETREYSSNGRLSSTTRFARSPDELFQLRCGDARRMAGVLDEFAKGLAGDVDAGKQLEPGRRPGGHAAVENGDVRVIVARQDRGSARGEAVAIVAKHDARCRGAARAAQILLRSG